MNSDKPGMKKRGMSEAKEWLLQARSESIVNLAGCQFEYGETLNQLIGQGHDVPRSSDPDFSNGFFKQVKGHTVNVIRKHQERISRQRST